MDWVFTPSWDLTELDMDVLPQKNQDMEAFPVDETDRMFNRLSQSLLPSSPSGSSKKPRVESGEQQVCCLVDGCRADLSGCREYHRRHRVCATHSKTPVVRIGGKEQRFCQQCSRFHSLGEFDEVKRSCRKRLDGHNRRRRKPRHDSIYFNYGSFFTNHQGQGAKLLHFGGLPAAPTFGDWPEKQHKVNHKFQVTADQRAPSDSYRKPRFPFLLGVDSDQSFSESSFQHTNASLGHYLVEPKGVLYLLSNSTHNSSVSGPTNNLVQFDRSASRSTSYVTGPNSGHANNQFFRTEGLLENEAAQVLSFSWD